MHKSSKKTVSDKVLNILIIIFVITAALLIIFKIVNRNNLSNDNALVTELHNYFKSDDLMNCNGLFNYSDKLIKYEDVNNETKMCIAYQKASIKNVDTEELEKSKKKDTCKKDGMIFRVEEGSSKCKISKIEKSVINDEYKKLFGKEIEASESFKYDNFHICYLKDDYYYCGLSETFTYVLSSDSNIYRAIDKAVEKSGIITIYDYFIKINDNKCYNNYTTDIINEKCNQKYQSNKKQKINYKFLKKYGTKYVHTYKKSDDNTYYWVSSEPQK